MIVNPFYHKFQHNILLFGHMVVLDQDNSKLNYANIFDWMIITNF